MRSLSGSGGVYQPTTMYINETADRMSGTGTRYLKNSIRGSESKRRNSLLMSALFLLLTGTILLIVGALIYPSSQFEMEQSEVIDNEHGSGSGLPPSDIHTSTTSPTLPFSTSQSKMPFIILVAIGSICFLSSIAFFCLYWCKYGCRCPCCPRKMASVLQRIESHSKMSAGGPLRAQYGPPNPASPALSSSPSSSTTDAPPLHPHSEPPFTDVSEQQRLIRDDGGHSVEDGILMTPLRDQQC